MTSGRMLQARDFGSLRGAAEALFSRRSWSEPRVALAAGAAIGLAGGLAVGAEGFLGLRAPMHAAGEFVVFLAGDLVVHFLVAQMAAGSVPMGSRRIHICLTHISNGGQEGALYGGFHELHFVSVSAEGFGALRGGFSASGGGNGADFRAVQGFARLWRGPGHRRHMAEHRSEEPREGK